LFSRPPPHNPSSQVGFSKLTFPATVMSSLLTRDPPLTLGRRVPFSGKPPRFFSPPVRYLVQGFVFLRRNFCFRLIPCAFFFPPCYDSWAWDEGFSPSFSTYSFNPFFGIKYWDLSARSLRIFFWLPPLSFSCFPSGRVSPFRSQNPPTKKPI